MRKLVVGMLIGAALTFGIQAGAAGLLSKGDKVANVREVTFNGKTVGNAAIVNDSSLVPVRPISEALGLNVNFDGGKINLISPTPDPAIQEQAEKDIQAALRVQKEKEIADLQLTIDSRQSFKSLLQKGYDNLVAKGMKDDPEAAALLKSMNETQSQIDELNAKKQSLQTELEALTK